MKINSSQQDHETSAVNSVSMHHSSYIIHTEVIVVFDGEVELDGRVVDDLNKEDEHGKFHKNEVEIESLVRGMIGSDLFSSG